MKIVTFNIRCDYEQDGINSFCYRKPLILEKIKYEQPDIICFQEVLPHVAKWLKEKLEDYYVIGYGRNEYLEDEQTSIAYKKTVFNLIQMEVFWLSETPLVIASRYEDQSSCPRICTEALLQNLETHEFIRVFNTHLDHEGVGARRLGIAQILNQISKEESFMDAPTIITGDFNAFPDSEEMRIFQEFPAFVDLTANLEGTFHDYGQLQEPEKIDYIYADSRFLCRNAVLWQDSMDGVYLSDHYAICVEIYTK